MEYNTIRGFLPITEYGRNIKKMIDYTLTIEDRDKRSRLAKAIVNVMAVLTPNMRDNYEFKHKLWDHLFILSDYKLDVDSPFPVPDKIAIDHKPEKIFYPAYNIAFKHYGNNIERIIKKAIEMEDGQQKEGLIKTIANHMKKSYLTWNRESVTNEVIAENLRIMSGGKLMLGEDVVLSHSRDILASKNRKPTLNLNPGNGRKNSSFTKNRLRTSQNNGKSGSLKSSHGT